MKDVKREAKGDDGNRAKYERKRNNGRAEAKCARRDENKSESREENGIERMNRRTNQRKDEIGK